VGGELYKPTLQFSKQKINKNKKKKRNKDFLYLYQHAMWIFCVMNQTWWTPFFWDTHTKK
jgi:hypothetical protein